jgi:hypothetical protein
MCRREHHSPVHNGLRQTYGAATKTPKTATDTHTGKEDCEMTPDATIEKAITYLTATAPQIRRIEQQIWLNDLPYADVEDKYIVKETHERLSEDARVMLGLVLHYPDMVKRDLDKTPAANSYYVRRANNEQPYNPGRTLRYIEQNRGVSKRTAKRIFTELKGFVNTLGEHTRGTDYTTVATGAMMEEKK